MVYVLGRSLLWNLRGEVLENSEKLSNRLIVRIRLSSGKQGTRKFMVGIFAIEGCDR